MANIPRALARLGEEPSGRLLTLCRVYSRDGDAAPIMALSRVDSSQGESPVALMSVADIRWSDRVGAMLREVFGLTPAECSVASSIISGHSPESIAAQRKRSPQTIRTQLKSVLAKLSVHTQAELVRMVAALLQMDGEPALAASLEADPVKARVTLSRPRDRTLEIVTIGPDNGRPILFIHGMLDDYGVTRELSRGLYARRVRLIAPVRPWFGGVQPRQRTRGNGPGKVRG